MEKHCVEKSCVATEAVGMEQPWKGLYDSALQPDKRWFTARPCPRRQLHKSSAAIWTKRTLEAGTERRHLWGKICMLPAALVLVGAHRLSGSGLTGFRRTDQQLTCPKSPMIPTRCGKLSGPTALGMVKLKTGLSAFAESPHLHQALSAEPSSFDCPAQMPSGSRCRHSGNDAFSRLHRPGNWNRR